MVKNVNLYLLCYFVENLNIKIKCIINLHAAYEETCRLSIKVRLYYLNFAGC